MKSWCNKCGKHASQYPTGRCRACAAALVPVEERRERMRKTMAAMPPAQRRANSQKAGRSNVANNGGWNLTSEQQAELGRRGGAARAASMTSEQRSESMRHASSFQTPEQRRAAGLASTTKHGGWAHITPELRAENGRRTGTLHGPKGGYRSGRIRLGQRIERQRRLIVALETELAEAVA